MSTREQMELLADKLPEYKLAYVVAYMQGLLMADARTAAFFPFSAPTTR